MTEHVIGLIWDAWRTRRKGVSAIAQRQRSRLADMVADVHQVTATLPAGAGTRLMPGLDALQVIGQRAALRCLARTILGPFIGRWRLQRFELGFYRGDVRRHGLLEQRALGRVHLLRAGGELRAAQPKLTVMIISHREAALAACNRIFRVEDGQVTAC